MFFLIMFVSVDIIFSPISKPMVLQCSLFSYLLIII